MALHKDYVCFGLGDDGVESDDDTDDGGSDDDDDSIDEDGDDDGCDDDDSSAIGENLMPFSMAWMKSEF